MSRRQTEEGGLSRGLLLSTCFSAFGNALEGMGQKRPDWEDLGESEILGWGLAIVEGENYLASADEAGPLSAKDLAGRLYLWYCQGAQDMACPFEDLPAPQRLAWEATGRHLVNMLVYDPQEHQGSVESHEEQWGPWAKEKLALQSKPEIDQDKAAEEHHG